MAVLLSPAACRAARALLAINQHRLAEKAGVGISSLNQFETGKRLITRPVVAQIEMGLLSLGVDFVYEPGYVTIQFRSPPPSPDPGAPHSMQIRAGREYLRMNQTALAEAVGLSLTTVRSMESGSRVVTGYADTVRAVVRTLERHHVYLAPSLGIRCKG